MVSTTEGLHCTTQPHMYITSIDFTHTHRLTYFKCYVVVGRELITVKDIVDPLRCHPALGIDVAHQIARIHRILFKHVTHPHALGEQAVCQVPRLCVEVSQEDDDVRATRTLHKLQNLKDLVVSAAGVGLRAWDMNNRYKHKAK